MTGEVTSMPVIIDEMLLTTSSGQLWRRDLAGTWSNITPSPAGWGSARALFAVTGWTPSRGGRIWCVARSGLQVWCKENLTPWTLRTLPGSLGSDASIGSAALKAYRDDLFLGLGGASDGSRTCEVWRYRADARRWEAVSTDCLGHSDTTWLLSMEVFRGRLYLGSGGAAGLAEPVVAR